MVRVILIISISLHLLNAAPLQTFVRTTPFHTSFETVSNQLYNNYPDDGERRVNIGFTFTFNGVNYNQVIISTNGVLTFGNYSFDNNNLPIDPNSGTPIAPPNSIYPYWSHLDPSKNNGGTITYGTIGSGEDEHFVVSWNEVKFSNSAVFNRSISFQVVLYKNGDIRFRYNSSFFDAMSNFMKINDLTIGLKEDATHYDQYAYNQKITAFSVDILYSKIRQVELKKSSCVINDPVNTTNPKRIPGATIRYAVEVINKSASMTNVIVEDNLDSLFDTNTINHLQIQNGACDCLGTTSANNNGFNGSSAGINPVRLDFGTISSGTLQNPQIKCGYFEVKLR